MIARGGWFQRRIWVAAAVALGSCSSDRSHPDAAGATTTWRDESPHSARTVTVAPGVSLEILDWGGNGATMIFLSGLGDTGHEFDDFAPQWTDDYRVLALTRRGFGGSSAPANGYDIGTLASDIRTVMDSLAVDRAVFVGHSIAGDEMTRFAATYPGRVLKLVYLDAAHDRVPLAVMFAESPPPPAPPMTAEDSASPEAFRGYIYRSYGYRPAIGEVLSVAVFDSTGRYLRDRTPERVMFQVLGQLQHPAYPKIQAPALALYATVDSVQQMFPYWPLLDSVGRARAEAFAASFRPWIKIQPAQFRLEMSRGRAVELANAHHYIFMSNEAEVTREMRAFLAEP